MYLYRYDSLGNLVGSEKLTNNSLVLRTHHSYDNDNRLSAQGWQIGSDSFSQTYSYGEWDGNLSSIVLSKNNSSIAVNYTYDSLRRLSSVGNGIFTSTYSYWDDDESSAASPRLKSIVHDGVNYGGKVVECNYTYGYDANGNITSAAFGIRENTYVYDANNQLIRENNDRRQYTQTWEYDAFGNIIQTNKYPYTTGELGDPTSTVNYGYTDSDWGDLLTEYNGLTIDYDNIGNPLTVKDSNDNVVESFTWTQGRQMASHTTNGVTWSYTYDADGLRTGRTDGTNTFEYIYAGDKLVRLVKNGEVVDFGYAGGQLATMSYDGATYYYVLNGQGDVVALTDNTGKMIIGYHYSAYGFPTLLKTDSETYNDLKYLNPFMYRGYVFDIETKFYYLQSRYYDPELGRFINADAYASTGQGILGNNMFSYCNNNPVVFADQTGTMRINSRMKAFDEGIMSSVPDVGEGNYFNFDSEDMSYSKKSTYFSISRAEANRFYEIISAGDFGQLYEPPILDWFLSALKYGGDLLSLIFDFSDHVQNITYNNTCDPEGRLLYIESGYTIVTIERGYYDSDYWASETEYFIFDRNMVLVYNDVISNVYMPGM